MSTAILNQRFFADLLARLKQASPGITNATKTQSQSWFNFAAGRSGTTFNWSFGKGDVLRVELYFSSPDQGLNKAMFDALAKEKDEIEAQIGSPLAWERLDGKNQSRIRTTHPARVSDSSDQLEPAKQWAVETMIKFVDTFRPRLKELDLR